MSRKAFDEWCETILKDNPNWRESGDAELGWQAWQAASKVAFREGYEKGVAAFDEAVLLERSKAPAWHDAPTVPGIWLCDEGGPDCYTYTAHNIVLLNDPALKDDECRWYGPIPQGGAKAEGRTE